MSRFSTPLTAAALGLGLVIVVPSGAQITPTGQTTTTATARSAGILDSTTSTGVAVLRDANRLVGAAVSTTGGPYGNIADLIVDATGQVQYVLVERRGQAGEFHPVPFSLLQFSSTGDVGLTVSAATLDTVTVDRNNLKSLTDRAFAAQLRAAFGANVARGFVRADGSATSNAASSGASTTATTTTGSNSKTSLAELRGQVFSLIGLLGGTITASNGAAGTISTVAINPDGSIAYAVGTNAAGTTRFALPFSQATLTSNFNGLTSTATLETLASIMVPQGSLPTFADSTFSNALTTAFGNQGSTTGFGIVGSAGGSNAGIDSVAGAGDPSRGGKSAVAGSSKQTGRTFGDSSKGNVGTPEAMSRNQSNAVAGRTSGNVGTPEAQSRNASNAVSGPTSGNVGTPEAQSRNASNAASGSTFGNVGATEAATRNGATASAGGLVNAPAETPAASTTTSQNGLIQMRDLLSFRIQAQDGAFGRVSDVVFDRNGNVQFLMGSFQGQTFPLPFSAASFSTTTPNTLQFDASIAQMQQLAIDPNNLPMLSDPSFLQGMRDVFGQSFGASAMQTNSAYTSPAHDPAAQTPVPGRDAPRPRSATDRDPVDSTPSPGTGANRSTTGIGNANSGAGSSQATLKDPTGKSLTNNSRTGANQMPANQSGTTTGTGQTGTAPGQRTWTWPNNPRFQGSGKRTWTPPPGSGREFRDDRPGLNKGATGSNSSGKTQGTGSRTWDPSGSGREFRDDRTGINKGASGSGSKSGGSGGAGASGGSSGTGTSGSGGSTGGSTGGSGS